MDRVLRGRALKLGDDINTDYIIPTKYLVLYEPEDLGEHALEGLGEDYPQLIRGYDFLVAGHNFGLASAREQAPNALKGAGVKVIVAKSFARIFYRNALNVGIAAVECVEAVEATEQGDEMEIDLTRGTIASGGKLFHFTVFSDFVMSILDAGGMLPLLARDLERQGGMADPVPAGG
jgi:3-isopropylmalate/(R)-2-methylmalate dehydratase small subunit